MKNCHVCNFECKDEAEVCPICGAFLLEVKQTEVEQSKEEKREPVILATFEDLVSAEIFCDILTDNEIPYSNSQEDMRIVFGGGFAAQEIYVDEKDYDKAKELYEQFLQSEADFMAQFDDEFYEEP